MEASKKNKIQKSIEWYIENRPTYESLSKKVESIIKDVLNDKGITFYSISSRSKEIDSFAKKAEKDKYTDPKSDIKDLAGIRIITYVKSEVEQVCEIIKPLFEIDPDHSIDKTEELGNDRVGYRSVHYVAKLTDSRLILPEYSIYKNLFFEIQVRTILEHAWADISHDRSYKFKGVLPENNDIERRFSLLSATLELVDREFNKLALEIDEYARGVEVKTKEGDLDIPIDTTSIREFLQIKLKDQIEKGCINPNFGGNEVVAIEELGKYGIKKLSELEKIMIDGKYYDNVLNETNFLGYLRDAMIVHDPERYFKKAWHKNKWDFLDVDFALLLEKHGINPEDISSKYNLKLDTKYFFER